MEIGATAAAAATAAATTAGVGLFSYNRGNYQMDAKNRYTRFTAGLNSAIAQTGMYRQDITDLTNLTVTRMDCYHVIAAMGLTILTAIYCPGRLGLHTPPPPGWLMGLAFLNIAGCYMFLGLCVWLNMHAAARADTAATHMLTRFVRLPIPSQGSLDKARKFLASFEEQPLREVFRIPFTRHRHSEDDQAYNEHEIDDGAKARARRGLDVPAWYRMEKEVGRKNNIDTVESMMPLAGKGSAPEHFEAYREIQNEWFPYDVYSRLSLFIAFMYLLQCWSYMQIGHQLQETRALFACAIVLLPMFVLQQIILTLDITPMGFPVHRIGPCALWFAYVAGAIEYKRWFTPGAQTLGFFLVYCAYAIHIIYTLSLIHLCAPSKDPPAVADTPGASWWPSEWLLPTAFQHAIWLVAPPKELEKGQVDIAGELRDQQRGLAGSPVARTGSTRSERRADVMRALGKQGESPAWFNVRTGLYAMLLGWIFLTFGFTIEVMTQGTATPSLLSAPGMPNNARDPRYRPAKVGRHEPTEVGTGGVAHGPARGVHGEAVHRRLEGLTPELLSKVADQPKIAKALHDLMPHLQELSRTGRHIGGQATKIEGVKPVPAGLGKDPKRMAVEWPALFEPQFLACGEDSEVILVLSRHGRGTSVMMSQGRDKPLKPTPFVLEGVATHGSLAATSWDADGLLLLTSTGVTLECPGTSPAHNGRWPCMPLPGTKLPISMEGKALATKVAIAREGTKGLRAAVLFPGDDSVTVFSRANRADAPWLPSGEVSYPAPTVVPTFTAGAESLLLTATDGAVTHLHMGTGHMAATAPAIPEFEGRTVPAACRSNTGDIVRLSRNAEQAAELLLG